MAKKLPAFLCKVYSVWSTPLEWVVFYDESMYCTFDPHKVWIIQHHEFLSQTRLGWMRAYEHVPLTFDATIWAKCVDFHHLYDSIDEYDDDNPEYSSLYKDSLEFS